MRATFTSLSPVTSLHFSIQQCLYKKFVLANSRDNLNMPRRSPRCHSSSASHDGASQQEVCTYRSFNALVVVVESLPTHYCGYNVTFYEEKVNRKIELMIFNVQRIVFHQIFIVPRFDHSLPMSVTHFLD